jgi:hypothetical protein
MNNIAITQYISLHALQIQNIKRDVVKKINISQLNLSETNSNTNSIEGNQEESVNVDTNININPNQNPNLDGTDIDNLAPPDTLEK